MIILIKRAERVLHDLWKIQREYLEVSRGGT